MFSVRRNYEKKIVEIEFNYMFFENNVQTFKMNRSFEELIGKTMEKLVFNIKKKFEDFLKEKIKQNGCEAYFPSIIAKLYDNNGQPVHYDTLNKKAWKDGFTVKINEINYLVALDLPYLKKLALPKLLITDMPVVIITEKEDKIIDKCKFKWYISSKEVEWELISEGMNNRMIYLNVESEKKFLKLHCIPNDGIRDGLPIEVISNNPIEKFFDLNELPMCDRHKLTCEKLNGNK